MAKLALCEAQAPPPPPCIIFLWVSLHQSPGSRVRLEFYFILVGQMIRTEVHVRTFTRANKGTQPHFKALFSQLNGAVLIDLFVHTCPRGPLDLRVMQATRRVPQPAWDAWLFVLNGAPLCGVRPLQR